MAERYLLKRVIAKGGMGIIFSALDEQTGDEVAVKLLRSSACSNPKERERFKREAVTASHLRHPHIVEVRDFGEDRKGALFLVSELLQGTSLQDQLNRKGALPINETLAILFPVMGALAYAHDHGVVHRDVKPANVFLSYRTGLTPVPKLLDFGIAAAIDRTRLTETDTIVGTLSYMAPEQILNTALGPSIDIWAIGTLFYHCLSGSEPFCEETITLQFQRLTQESVPPLSTRVKTISPKFCAAVEGALRHHWEKRYPHMRSMAKALIFSALSSNIAVPDSPDPIGFPDWNMWRQEAEQQECKTLPE